MRDQPPEPLEEVTREPLGLAAMALLPIEKIRNTSPRGKRFEEEIHEFLLTTFNGYTVSSGNISGHWKNHAGHDFYGEHRAYKVGLPGPEAVAAWELYLSELGSEMGEECIYVELGKEIFLLQSKRSTPVAQRQNPLKPS